MKPAHFFVSLPVATGLALLLLLAGRVHAIPPPWDLEAMKARAPLIALVRTGESETVKHVPGCNAQIGWTPIRVLKGRINEKPDQAKRYLVYRRQRDQAIPGVKREVAGSALPVPREQQVALAFLTPDPDLPHGYRIVCGKFGYLPLTAESEKGRQAILRRLEMYRSWSARVADDATRNALQGYYDQAQQFLQKRGGETDYGAAALACPLAV
jgi:hypothetical protein